eukprot:3122585-Amphidinium_carterae.3
MALDVTEPQILAHYPGDGAGFYWHHRILLHKLGGGGWVALTPDLELEVLNLAEQRHHILERSGAFPPHLAAQVYSFDPLGRGEVARFKRMASVQASLLDDQPMQDVDARVWVIADLKHPRFGETLSGPEVHDIVCLRDKGVLDLDGEEVFVHQMETSQISVWREGLKRGTGCETPWCPPGSS